MNFIRLFFILFFLCIFKNYAQIYKVTTYQTEQGLPTNLTKMNVQDDKGFVWICTDAGLIRYDGRQFIQYKEQFVSQYMKALHKTAKGELYLVHDMGLERIENQVDTVIFHHVLSGSTALTDSTLLYPKSVFEAADGKLWFGEPENVSAYDINTKKFKRYFLGTKNQSSSFIRSFSFAEDGFGSFYAVSQQGFLYYYDVENDTFIEVVIPNRAFKTANTLLQNKQGELLLGTDTGLFALSVTPQGKLLQCTLLANMGGVSCLAKDLHQNILIGTWNSGLFKATLQNLTTFQVTSVDNLYAYVINGVYCTPKGELWVSTDNGIAYLYMTSFAKLNLPFRRIYMQDITFSDNKSIAYLTDGADIYQIDLDRNTKFLSAKPNYQTIYKENDGDILALAYTQNTIWAGNSRGEVIKVSNKKVEKIKLGAKHKSVFYLYADGSKIWASRFDNDTLLQMDNQTNEIKYYTASKGIHSPTIATKRSLQGNLYTVALNVKQYLLKYNPTADKFENISKPIAAKIAPNWQVTDFAFDKNEKIYLGTNQGLFTLDNDSLRKIKLDHDYEIKAVYFDQKDVLWVSTDVGLLRQQHDHFILFNEFNGLSSKTMTYRAIDTDGMNRIWVATANGICFSQLEVVEKRQTPTPIFLGLKNNGKRIVLNDKELLFRSNSLLTGTYISLSFPTDRILYQYRISNINNNEWTTPEMTTELLIPNLGFGEYQMEIRALQQGGYDWSEPLQLQFAVEKPMYLQWWAIVAYILAAFGVIGISAKLYSRKLEKEKEQLEQVVTERTEKIKQQADAILAVHQTLEKKNKDIVASINYAKRIQDAMLPTLQDFEKRFGMNNFFVLFRPRDIVSGDFYWLAQVRKNNVNYTILSVADCTGHGVPGAFVSMVGCNILNNLVKENLIIAPNRILTLLDQEVRKTLQQDKGNSKDGMDIAIITLTQHTASNSTATGLYSHIAYAGAMNPLYYVQNGELLEIKATKKPIGGSEDQEKEYAAHEIVINYPTHIYLCSDGYQDQFGGTQSKKLMPKRLREYLHTHHQAAMPQQLQALQTHFELWKGTEEQIDDVTIVGVVV